MTTTVLQGVRFVNVLFGIVIVMVSSMGSRRGDRVERDSEHLLNVCCAQSSDKKCQKTSNVGRG